MTRNIYVVRHGQDEDNAAGVLNGRRDTTLTELGRKQAEIVASKLATQEISKIYSSPLKRAHETAMIIADKLGIDEIIVEPDLIEREFGIMTGKKIADITKYSKNNMQGDKVLYFIDPKGSELFPDLLERAKRVLARVQESMSGKSVLLVTHGDTGKMVNAAYRNWTWEEGIMIPYLDNTGVLVLNEETNSLR